MKSRGFTYLFTILLLMLIVKLMQMYTYDDSYRKETAYSKKKVDAYSKIEKTPRTIKDQMTNQSGQPIASNSKNSQASKETDKVLQGAVDSKDSSRSSEKEGKTLLEDLKKEYLAEKIALLQEDRFREDVVIRYYRHKKDGQMVDELRDLKYYIHEREATETRGLGSNIIYYGNDVNLEDIQLIALTLLENGIPIKSIQETRYEWKANAIEIGTETELLDAEPLTPLDIQIFTK
ncbi:MAG: hypothetical protein AAF789_06145 [Bacteroidota bacterium]